MAKLTLAMLAFVFNLKCLEGTWCVDEKGTPTLKECISKISPQPFLKLRAVNTPKTQIEAKLECTKELQGDLTYWINAELFSNATLCPNLKEAKRFWLLGHHVDDVEKCRAVQFYGTEAKYIGVHCGEELPFICSWKEATLATCVDAVKAPTGQDTHLMVFDVEEFTHEKAEEICQSLPMGKLLFGVKVGEKTDFDATKCPRELEKPRKFWTLGKDLYNDTLCNAVIVGKDGVKTETIDCNEKMNFICERRVPDQTTCIEAFQKSASSGKENIVSIQETSRNSHANATIACNGLESLAESYLLNVKSSYSFDQLDHCPEMVDTKTFWIGGSTFTENGFMSCKALRLGPKGPEIVTLDCGLELPYICEIEKSKTGRRG